MWNGRSRCSRRARTVTCPSRSGGACARHGASATTAGAGAFALDRRVVEHVLPRFEGERPGDDRPRAMLDLAEAVLCGDVDRQDAIVRAIGAFNEFDDLRDEDVSDAAIYAAQSAARVVGNAGWGEEPELLDDPDDDEARDADQWEAAFLASLAEAPSLPKMGVAEHAAPRRAFWRWYLSEAVPATGREP